VASCLQSQPGFFEDLVVTGWQYQVQINYVLFRTGEMIIIIEYYSKNWVI
jgi:hypothetical protein